MAQQLATLRTPAAYAGLTAYAHSHTGEAAAAAYLALGHAYLLDKRDAEAESALAEARRADGELNDYVDFLDAEASHEAGDDTAAENILHGFTDRYPESIFDDQAPELEANVLLGMNKLTAARQVLAAAAESPAADRPGFQLAEGEVEQALDQQQAAEAAFKRVLLEHPLSPEAQTARAKLTATGAEASLTVTELRSLADAYYNAGRYEEAEELIFEIGGGVPMTSGDTEVKPNDNARKIAASLSGYCNQGPNRSPYAVVPAESLERSIKRVERWTAMAEKYRTMEPVAGLVSAH